MAKLSPDPRFRAFDAGGNPLAGGKIYSYLAGTSTPKATYVDSTETTPNTNPIIADSDGYFDLWLGSGGYKLVLADADENILWTVDGINLQVTPLDFLQLPEGSAPAGVAANDVIYGDSASHRLKMKNNNGAADFIVGRDTIDTLTNKTLTAPTINTPAVANPTVNSGVGANGSGIKHKRVAATNTAAGANSVSTTTVTWTTPFADANYTVIATLDNNGPAGSCVSHVSARAAGSVVVEISNGPVGGIAGGTIHCIAIHD